MPLQRPWVYQIYQLVPGMRTSGNVFFGSLFQGFFVHDVREALPVYATHALGVADDSRPKTSGPGMILAMVLALVVAYGVSSVSLLYVEYTHAGTLNQPSESPLNPWAVERAPKAIVLSPAKLYAPPAVPPAVPHGRVGQFTFGAMLVAGLSALRLRWVAWPLHPVGFLLAFSYATANIWFSVFLGWLAKVLVLKLGGAGFFRSARSFFIGLVAGEAGAVACFIVVAPCETRCTCPSIACCCFRSSPAKGSITTTACGR